jgi:hypothetical protein
VPQTQRLPSGPTAAVDSMRALREALKTLKKNGVELEDPGDEIAVRRLPYGCRAASKPATAYLRK